MKKCEQQIKKTFAIFLIFIKISAITNPTPQGVLPGGFNYQPDPQGTPGG